MKKYYKYIGGLATMSLPLFAAAQTVSSLLNNIRGWINTIIPIVSALAVLVFIWGLVKFVTSAGDEEKRKEGRNIMIYGLIALAIIFGLSGFVTLMSNVFGVSGGGQLNPPSVGSGVGSGTNI